MHSGSDAGSGLGTLAAMQANELGSHAVTQAHGLGHLAAMQAQDWALWRRCRLKIGHSDSDTGSGLGTLTAMQTHKLGI